MNIEPTYNMQKVKSILMLPEIWDKAAEDGIDKEAYYPGFDPMCGWLLCKYENNIAGIIYVHNDNVQSIKIHPYILNEYQGKGKDMIFSFYKWLIDNCKNVTKVLITIPFCYRRVYKFAKRVGFIDEGINRQSFIKNGKLEDQWNLGLTVDEIKGLIA